MLIAGFLPESFVDWRGKMVATVFTYGCNFRCPFCHNYALVTGELKTRYSEDWIISQIKELQGWIDGVCITGGEPTIHPDIARFVREISKITPVKIDTNGTNPMLLKELLEYVDYVAMDIKAPKSKYSLLTGIKGEFDKIENSIQLIRAYARDYEFRTTVVPTLSIDDFESIAEWLHGAKRYVLQQFSGEGGTLNPEYSLIKPKNKGEIEKICNTIRAYFGECLIANL